jgi:hypothetical protein
VDVSRKNIDFSKTPISEVKGYIDEFGSKYAKGKIARVTSSGMQTGGGPSTAKLIGTLNGEYILEVPVQTSAVPNEILVAAKKTHVTIRDVAGTVYQLAPATAIP